MRIEEIIKNVFNANFPTQRELGRTFVRIQEYYENPEFKGRVFTLDEFKDWYIHNTEDGRKSRKFGYYDYWDGFNIPSHVLNPFYRGDFNPLSEEEKKLLDVLSKESEDIFYLIVTHGMVSAATMRHETSHGLFYLNPDYRRQALDVINSMDPVEKDKVTEFLRKTGGYDVSVYDDETQAYLLDRRCLGANHVSGEGLKLAGDRIKKIFNKFYVPKNRVIYED